MTRSNKAIAGAISLLLLTADASSGGSKSAVQIVPFRAEVSFSEGCSANAWIGHIESAPGEAAYELVIEPQDGGRARTSGWEVSLYDSEDRKTNLLAPLADWHGLQPFHFVPRDFRSGPEKSAFGVRRTIKVEGRGLVVELEVKESTVAALAGGNYAFTDLRVSLAVNNLK